MQLQPVDAHDVAQAARKLWPEEVVTDRYHFLGFPRRCVAEVFAVLKPGSNLQRLF